MGAKRISLSGIISTPELTHTQPNLPDGFMVLPYAPYLSLLRMKSNSLTVIFKTPITWEKFPLVPANKTNHPAWSV